jgi:DNA-binding GntR family transcriptional regulator
MPETEQAQVQRPTEDSVLVRLRDELDSSSRVPLYEQIRSGISHLIQSELLPAGTMLPPEPELARVLGVSRQTVNQALSDLAQRQMVSRRRGVGTVVNGAVVEQRLDQLYSFLHTLLAQGRMHAARLLGYRPAVEETASELLTGDKNGLIFELDRLLIVDGEPAVIETFYLPRHIGEALPIDLAESEALYDLLRDYCGVIATQATETLRPIALQARDAALLKVPVGDAAFLVERIGYSGDQPIELRRSVIRGDRYRFQAHLTAEGLTPRAESQ